MNKNYILDMVHHNPGEPRYESRYNNPAEIAEMGYNGKVYSLFESPELAVDWNAVEPELFAPDSPEEAWRLELFNRLKVEFARCHQAGLKVYAMSDLVLLPRKLLECHSGVADFGDVNQPIVVCWLRTLVSLIFEQFPEMDGLVVRIGETYLFDAPHHIGRITDKKNPERTIIPLMKLLREEVCVKHGKELFFRTWGSFDEDATVYQQVSDAVEPHEKLILCVKHCEGDFHRGNPFSKIIGMGRHRQLIEVQCAREYEGKGAFPNYITNGVINGFPEHACLRDEGKIASIRDFAETKPELFAGVWTWTRGGGWEGPYIKNELWCDLNAATVARWAKNPEQPESEIFNAIALERIGILPDDIAKFRELALLSADAVWLGRCSRTVKFHPWWLRDEYIGIPDLPDMTDDSLLREKDESIMCWEKIVKLTQEIRWPDAEIEEFAITSAKYGLYLFKIIKCVFQLTLAEQRQDLNLVSKYLNEYNNDWEDYRNLTKYKSCSTLFCQDIKRSESKSSAELVARLKICV
jgi:hypothetical protein